ncbi:MAG: carotenoid biosynthesis protein [Candidatus Planktophila sp.]|nr:carotenoid biosynthesis protein [Candidatus Planktophila sp.]
MSIRHYSPRRNRRRGISSRAQLALNLTLGIAILLQISYPLLSGEALRVVTISTVYWAAGAMALHALLAFGARYAFTYLGITLSFGFLIELMGLKTSWPFGTYEYDPSLGPQLFDVPLVVPFAWAMIAHPILCAARRVSGNWVFLYGGFGLMAYDLFLDPQMVTAGRWKWEVTGSHVPFTPEVPLSNAFGWLLSGMALIAILHLTLSRDRRKVSASFITIDIFLIWTWFAGVISNLFFFDRPGIAFIFGLTFGAVLAPYIFSRWLGRP